MIPSTRLPNASLLDRWGFLFVPCAVMLALLWLPFGFSIIGLIEEWPVLHVFMNQGPQYWLDADSAMAAHRLRPFTVLPHAISYALDHDSFFYWHVLLIAALLLKGLAGALLGWWLTHSRRWAIFLGLLLVFNPADTMQLSFRAFHINWSISLAVAAMAACVFAYTLHKAWFRVFAMAIAIPCAITATFAYEAALLLTPGVFLLLYARFGVRAGLGMLRLRPVVTLAWILAAAINAGYICYVYATTDTYQHSVLAGGQWVLAQRAARFLTVGYGHSLLGGWLDTVSILRFEYASYLYLVAAGIVGVLVSRRWLRSSIGLNAGIEIAAAPTHLGRLALAGLLLIALGYLPFAASWAHMQISQRTFLCTVPGAALVTLAVLIALARRAPGLGSALAVLTLVLGFSFQLFQFEHYRRISVQQQDALARIIEQLPLPDPTKTIVVIDKDNLLNGIWMLQDGTIPALSYLYNRPVLNVVVCRPDNEEWQQSNAEGRTGHCVETEDGWKVGAAPLSSEPNGQVQWRPIHRQDASVVYLDRDIQPENRGPAALEHLRMLRTGEDPASRRYRNILRRPEWPLHLDLFRPADGGDRWHWDFSRWWSMDLPVHGVGWGLQGWMLDKPYLPLWRSAAWKMAPRAILNFDLSPANSDYKLEVRILNFDPPAAPDNVRISINGVPVQSQWHPNWGFTATVPASALRRGQNRIEFESPVSASIGGLSFMMDWVSLTPVQP